MVYFFSGHRASQGCVVLDGGRNGKMAAGVRYDRYATTNKETSQNGTSQNGTSQSVVNENGFEERNGKKYGISSDFKANNSAKSNISEAIATNKDSDSKGIDKSSLASSLSTTNQPSPLNPPNSLRRAKLRFSSNDLKTTNLATKSSPSPEGPDTNNNEKKELAIAENPTTGQQKSNEVKSKGLVTKSRSLLTIQRSGPARSDPTGEAKSSTLPRKQRSNMPSKSQSLLTLTQPLSNSQEKESKKLAISHHSPSLKRQESRDTDKKQTPAKQPPIKSRSLIAIQRPKQSSNIAKGTTLSSSRFGH